MNQVFSKKVKGVFPKEWAYQRLPLTFVVIRHNIRLFSIGQLNFFSLFVGGVFTSFLKANEFNIH